MSYLLYYREEEERQPDLHAAKATPEEVLVAVRKLDRHFLPKDSWSTEVRFTSGSRVSHCAGREIVFNRDVLTWLLVAHEFAHRWHARRKHEQALKIRLVELPYELLRPDVTAKLSRLNKQRSHGKQHARLVDRACDYIRKLGWHTGNIAHELALKDERAVQREKLAACPPPIDFRIDKRREQVKRLERKIKALATRLKRAKRSLGALERSKTKQT